MSCLLLKNASVRNCSIDLPVKLSPTGRDRAAAHVPLPRITMSKSCPSARTFIMPEKQSRPQERASASGAEGVYREVVKACQTGNAAVLRKFCRAGKRKQFWLLSAPEKERGSAETVPTLSAGERVRRQRCARRNFASDESRPKTEPACAPEPNS